MPTATRQQERPPKAQKHHEMDMKDPKNQDEKSPYHPHPHVSMKNQDSLTWFMDEAFSVTDIQPSNPFHRPLSTLVANAPGDDGSFRVNSGPAAGPPGHYKAKFQVTASGQIIDPDFNVD